ncbi:MAG: ECF-type sigma factor [Pirellulaceae bacterium]
MTIENSVTHWMHKLAGGDQVAAELLWKRYCHQLMGLARKHLRHHPRRASDEEDVALSAFHVFCKGAAEGRFPELHDRDNLWRLLVVITARKASDHLKHEKPRTPPGGAASQEVDVEQVIGNQPTPEFAAAVADQCDRLLAVLCDSMLQKIATMKLDSFTNEEIAAELGVSVRTVERKLSRIRAEWETVLTETLD